MSWADFALTRVTSESFRSWPRAETAAIPRDSAVRKRYASVRRTSLLASKCRDFADQMTFSRAAY